MVQEGMHIKELSPELRYCLRDLKLKAPDLQCPPQEEYPRSE